MSLLIAEHIRKKLSDNPKLTEVVGDRMYPCVVTSETEYPFIVYTRDECTPSDTKDGFVYDNVSESVYIFSDDYTESVNVAELVRSSLANSTGDYDLFSVSECLMTSASESFAEDAFAQVLTFNIITE